MRNFHSFAFHYIALVIKNKNTRVETQRVRVMKQSRSRPWLLCTTSPLLRGSRPRMAHQTAAPHRVQPRLPQALASTWHHNEEHQLGKEKASGGAGQMQFPKYGATCKKEYKKEHNTQAHTVAAHTLVDGCVVSFDSGGSQGRNSWGEQWETTELFRKRVWKQHRHKLSATLPYKSK